MQSEVIGLVIMGFCVLFFITRWLPASVTGTLGCLLMVLTRVCTFEEAFSGFSNSIVVLMFSAMIVGIAMFKTGVAQLLGRTAIRWAHGNERVFLVTTCFVAGLLAMFLANTAILAALIPIVDSVCRTSTQMKRRNLLLPMACAVMLGGSCTLIGCTPQLTANALLSKMAQVEMTMWSLTGPGLCLLAAFLVYLALFGYRDSQRIWGGRPEPEMEVEQEKLDSILNTQVDSRKMGTMLLIAAGMILSYILALLPTAETALCAAMLCIVTGCCNVKDITKELHWESVIFLGSCLGLGNALTVAGSGELMGRMVSRMLGSVTSPFLIFAVLVTWTLLLSQFITNSTAIIVVLPIALSLCSAYGFNPMAFCIGITLAASVACCTPLAAAQITMTQVGGYEFLDYMRFGWKPTLLFLAGILVAVPLFYPLA